jgi:acyl-homoserine lactone acylase PvdQ
MKIVKKPLSFSFNNCDSNCWIGVLWFYLKPKYEGKVELKSIHDETTVYFDFGGPHIYANNAIDAMTALGYVHAQDRLWQMELNVLHQDDCLKFSEE